MAVKFPLDIFYDGSCPVCSREMASYKKNNPYERLNFIDISAEDFDPQKYGKTQDEFMSRLHVRDAEGHFATGVDAFIMIWQAYPDGSVYRLLSAFVGFPGFHLLSKAGYAVFARYRHLLPKRKKDCGTEACDLEN